MVAGRSLFPLISVLESARRAGVLIALSVEPGMITTCFGWLDPARFLELSGSAHEAVLAGAALIWTRVHGAVSIELSGRYPPYVADPEALYVQTIRAIVHSTIKL